MTSALASDDISHDPKKACPCCESPVQIESCISEEGSDSQSAKAVDSIDEAFRERITSTAVHLRATIDHCEIPMSCSMSSSSMGGTFNMVFVLTFDDKTKWIVRVPRFVAEGDWTDAKALHMRQVVDMVRWIKNNTTVPVPIVHAFDSSFDNPVGRPILMEDFIEGSRVDDAWQDLTANEDELRRRKAQNIHDVAKTMVDLGRLRFSAIGYPEINDGKLTEEMLPAFQIGSHLEGPFPDVGSYLRAPMERQPWYPDDFHTIALRIMLDWVASTTTDDEFALFHPDLHEGNIIIGMKLSCQIETLCAC